MLQQEKNASVLDIEPISSPGSDIKFLIGLVPNSDQNSDPLEMVVSDEEEAEYNLSVNKNHFLMMKMFFS